MSSITLLVNQSPRQLVYKQLLDEVFVISRIIKVEVRVISLSLRLRLITLTSTLIILDITKTESNNCFIIHWTKKNLSHVFASSLTASNTKRANLTWLPLEIMHRGHTWHDYPWPWHDYSWPWHDYCIICSLWRHGRWFRKFAVLFRPIRKELESSMYNNSTNQARTIARTPNQRWQLIRLFPRLASIMCFSRACPWRHWLHLLWRKPGTSFFLFPRLTPVAEFCLEFVIGFSSYLRLIWLVRGKKRFFCDSDLRKTLNRGAGTSWSGVWSRRCYRHETL